MRLIEIDLKKLTHNYNFLRSQLDPKVKMIGVVKANAYGSSINIIAHKLVELGIEALAVAYVDEGIVLKKAGIEVPVLVFYPQVHNFKKVIEYQLEPALYSKRSWLNFKKLVKETQNLDYPVHIKYNTPELLEGFSSSDCPNVLIQEGKFIYLYNSSKAKIPGVNPLRFNNLEEYSEFVDWSRSQGIRCPVLFLQQMNDTQGGTSYKVRPSIFDQQGGLPQAIVNDNVTPLVDASHKDDKFNKGDYPGFDPKNQNIGLTTPLDKMFHQGEKDISGSDNPMDANWVGVKVTEDHVKAGKYKDDEVYI